MSNEMYRSRFNEIFDVFGRVKKLYLGITGMSGQSAEQYLSTRYSYDVDKHYQEDMESLKQVLSLIYQDIHLIFNAIEIMMVDLDKEVSQEQKILNIRNLQQYIKAAHRIVTFMNKVIFSAVDSDDLQDYTNFIKKHNDKEFSIGDYINKIDNAYLGILEMTKDIK